MTQYIAKDNLVVTTLSGRSSESDIETWHHHLQTVLNALPQGTKFKILVNLHGFKASNFEAHKKFRVIIPQTLASYGWYVGYLRLFPEAKITINATKSVYCVAAAHVHDDETKIKNYADNYSMKNEAFFTNAQAAQAWINNITIPS